MIEEKAKRFELATKAFKFGFQQDVFIYIETVEQQGFTVDDIREYHLYKLKEFATTESIKGASKSCLICSAIMFAYPVNISSETQTGDPTDKTVWLCQNQNCMHTIYNKETIEELSSEGGT